jgi:hypothetical protein
VPVINMSNVTNVRGISVDVQFAFKTFFMPLLGRNYLTASGYGLGFVGALGGATGADLVPLAISDTAAAAWQASNDTTNNWWMGVYTSTAGLTSRYIEQSDLRMLSLKPGGALPTSGASGDCGSATPVDSLAYWWCKGTPYEMVTTPDPVKTVTMPPSGTSLKSAVTSSVRIPGDILMPVYNQLDLSGHVKIVGFLAVHLTSYQNTGTYKGVLKGKMIDYYLAPGPISGESSGFFDTYAINLVR